MPAYIKSLTDSQLTRLWSRIWSRTGDGGPYGWDHPTMAVVHPHLYRVLLTISVEGKVRSASRRID